MSAAPFSWPLALRAMNASICAYQVRGAHVAPLRDAPILRSVPGTDGAFVYDVVPTCQDAVGFVGPSADYTPAFRATGEDEVDAAAIGLTEDGYGILAFRGTLAPNLRRHDFASWLIDWLNDADAIPEPWSAGGHGKGRAESGFARAVRDLWPWIEDTLTPLQPRMPNGLIVTGHSKGGAMTFLGASLARAKWRDPEIPVQVFAFAPPVTGNAAFAAGYAASGLGPSTHRIHVTKDAVPFLPRWDEADIWAKVRFRGLVARLGWDVVVALADELTGSGYTAVGDATVIASDGGAVAQGHRAVQAALEEVVTAIEHDEIASVAEAHGAVQSYLPMVASAARAKRPAT